MNNLLLWMGAPGGEGNPMSSFVFFGAIILVFYFFMIRPQTKKAKDQRNFISEVQKGTKVVTTGGIFGTVVNMDDNTVTLDCEGGSKIRILKTAISFENSKLLNQKK